MSAAPLPRPEIKVRGGFSKLPNNVIMDWMRLMSGSVQITVIIFINSEIHVPREKGSPAPKWTRPITHAELATVCRCTIRAVEIKLKDLMERRVVEGKRTATGFRYHVPFETWHELPDMQQVVEIDPEAPTTDESEDQDTKEQRTNKFKLHEKPQMLGAGKRSRPVEMGGFAPDKCSVKTAIPLTYNVEVANGTVVFNVLGGEQIAKREEKAKPNRTSGRFASPEVVDNSSQPSFENFHLFQNIYMTHGINFAPDDWAGARAAWARMNIEQRLAAVVGVQTRFDQKEYDPSDPKWIHKPYNFLDKQIWLATVRPRKQEKVKVFKDEATVMAARKWAQDQDRKAGRS